MKAKEFNKLKEQVRGGNVEGLKDVISELTLKQAQTIEDLIYDLELDEEMNEVLDEIVNYITNLVEAEKVANKKANKPAPKKEEKEEKKKEEKEEKKKEEKPKNGKIKKLTDTLKVGDTVKFQVEGEEIQHHIKIVHIGKYNIIGVMAVDEKEVFNIRKVDFNKQIFEWRDRHGEEYNIIVSL